MRIRDDDASAENFCANPRRYALRCSRAPLVGFTKSAQPRFRSRKRLIFSPPPGRSIYVTPKITGKFTRVGRLRAKRRSRKTMPGLAENFTIASDLRLGKIRLAARERGARFPNERGWGGGWGVNKTRKKARDVDTPSETRFPRAARRFAASFERAVLFSTSGR